MDMSEHEKVETNIGWRVFDCFVGSYCRGCR